MPSSDLVLNVKQIAGYPDGGTAAPTDEIVLQRGGLGGPYYSLTSAELVGTALGSSGPMQIGMPIPPNAAPPQLFAYTICTPNDGAFLWNAYLAPDELHTMSIAGGPSGQWQFDPAGGLGFSWGASAGAAQPVAWTNVFNISPQGYVRVGEQVMLGRDPAAPMEAATAQWVQATIQSSIALLQSFYSTATVWSFNRRTGNIILNLNDVMGAGGAPIFSPVFQGQPTAPSPQPASNDNTIATTAWVLQHVNTILGTTVVSSFNGRIGSVVLTAADVTGVGGLTASALTPYAPLANPAFSGNATAPTAPIGTNDGQIATTAFVMAAVTASTSGVLSFNTRTGAVVLTTADITNAGGAVLASPTFTGTPSGPTAAPGTNNTQLATTAFVMGANVTSFNTRIGAVVLTAADVTAAGGAVLTSPAFSGTPTAPTAAPGTNTTQIATTAFVEQVIAAGIVQTFNGRSGAVSLQANDVSAAGGALTASPTFTGAPLGPTAAPGTNTTQLATTAFVMAALGVAGGVSSFNGRAGAVTLQGSDITGAGGALLAGPAFTGVPTAPTPATADSSTTLATTAFVKAAAAAAYLPLTGGALTGALTITASAAVNYQLRINSPNNSGSWVQLNSATGANLGPMGIASTVNNNARWNLNLGNAQAEAGSNAGSDFSLGAASDTGTFINNYMWIKRSTGVTGLGPLGAGLCSSGSITNTQIGVGCSAGGYAITCRNTVAGTNYAVGFLNNAGGFVGTIVPTDTATAFNTTSDVRLKTNDHPFVDGWKIIRELPIKVFTWKTQRSQDVGVMAQEVEPVYPHAVSKGRGEPGDEDYTPWGVDYSKYVPILIQALQDAFKRIEALEARLT